MKLRILTLAVIATLGACPSLAFAHSHQSHEVPGADLEELEASARAGNAMAASKLADLYLKSPDPRDQAKAIDALSACDSQMHPICRVDLGLAYGRQALREDLEDDQRQQLARQSVFRITHVASMGNPDAAQLLTELHAAGLAGRSAGASVASKPQSAAKDLVQGNAGAAHAHKVGADQKAILGVADEVLKHALEPVQVTAKAIHSSGFPTLAAISLPVLAMQAAPEPVPAVYSHASILELQEKLDQAMEQLVAARLQLEESNRTITDLRGELQLRQPPAIKVEDATSLNRKALDAAMVGNYETAIPLFRKAAEQNHAGAINNLAAMFINGTGVARDVQQAVSLFERAAALGNAEAAENAARIYNYGIGRNKDPSRARTWYGKAIALGSQRALQELAEMERLIQAGMYH